MLKIEHAKHLKQIKNTIRKCFDRKSGIKPRIANEMKNGKIAFFDENGILVDVYPRNHSLSLYDDRQTAYSSDYIFIGSHSFNLNNARSIDKMPVISFMNCNAPVVFRLDYIFKSKAGISDDKSVCLVSVKKAYDLMITSDMWQRKDYIALASRLMKIGEFDKAEKLYNSAVIQIEKYRKERFLKRIEGYDLVICSANHDTCGLCSMYQNRVYSISGKDKRFPKLPDNVLEICGFHEGCRHILYPFYYYDGCVISQMINDSKNNTYYRKDYDAISYSNRPFVDERTPEEKEAYLHYLQESEKYISTNFEKAKAYYLKRWDKLQEYELVKKVLPDSAPKSFSGYSRMKNGNTKNYQKIVADMKSNGYSDFNDK